jgi:hypothetical protein
MAVTALIDRYCDVWNEPDANRRGELLAAIWAPGASYTDPTVHAPDAPALLAHIAGVRDKRPGAKIERTSQVDMHHGLARFEWRVTGADGTVLREGLDIAIISPEATMILRMIGFFGPLPGAGVRPAS